LVEEQLEIKLKQNQIHKDKGLTVGKNIHEK
jgi:hypothetical protein